MKLTFCPENSSGIILPCDSKVLGNCSAYPPAGSKSDRKTEQFGHCSALLAQKLRPNLREGEQIQFWKVQMSRQQDPATVAGLIIAVIDGMGGGIGAQIVSQLREELPLEVEVLALGANAIATQKMMQARASRGASGENAVRVSIGEADVILAPIGVVVPNSMMGEITPAIAEAVAGAPGRKLLLPINQPHFEIVGIEWKALTKQISAAIEIIRQALES
jgi:hypothetical protein